MNNPEAFPLIVSSNRFSCLEESVSHKSHSKAGATFSICNNPCKLAEEEALFITTDFTSDRGENLFCFRHPLKQRTDPPEYFKAPFHTIIKSSLNVTFLLNGLVSSSISVTKAHFSSPVGFMVYKTYYLLFLLP